MASNRSGSRVSRTCLRNPTGAIGSAEQSLSLLDDVREADETVGLVEHGDIDHLRVEDLTESVADEVVHRLHLEVLGEPALHVVDERELGVALAGLLEQPGVLERDAEAAGERREQADVRLAERVLPVDVLERDHARSPCPRRRAAPTPPTWEPRPTIAPGWSYSARSSGVMASNRSGSRVSRTCLRNPNGRLRLDGVALALLDRCRGSGRARRPDRARRCRRPARRRSLGGGRRPGRTSPASRGSRRALAARR